MPSFRVVTLKVHQQTDLHFGQFHISQQLCLVDTFDLVHALQFDDESIFHEYIKSIATAQSDPFVLDWLRVLELKCNTVQLELMCQALFVGRFEQAQSQFPMDFDGTTDHATRKIVELHIFVLFVFFVVLYSRRRLVEPTDKQESLDNPLVEAHPN